jgi:hypothetical protein
MFFSQGGNQFAGYNKVSLLANAISLPAFMALIVGSKPAKPTMAVSTISISGWVTILYSLVPAITFTGKWASASFTCWYLLSSQMMAYCGTNSNACSQ